MGEYIFDEQLEIKYGRLSSIVKAVVVFGAVSLRMELRMFPCILLRHPGQ